MSKIRRFESGRAGYYASIRVPKEIVDVPEKKQIEISPAEGKLGVLLVGLGAVSTTFIAGVEAVKKGFAQPIGSLTQMGTIRLGKRTDNRVRSEEHTSELQSPCNLVCRLLLEKKKTTLRNKQ